MQQSYDEEAVILRASVSRRVDQTSLAESGVSSVTINLISDQSIFFEPKSVLEIKNRICYRYNQSKTGS